MFYRCLLLSALLLSALIYAGPDVNDDALAAHWHQHREQRLQSALENGSITPEEAQHLRQHWQRKDEQQRQFLNTLTPEQRLRLQRMEDEQRARRREFMDSLSPQQRQQLRLQHQFFGDGEFDDEH